MNENLLPWGTALAVFLGTAPMFGVIVWNMMDVRALRSEMRAEFSALRSEMRAELLQIRNELMQIRIDLGSIRERVATLEERDRLTHPHA
jgi:hypothetical protein